MLATSSCQATRNPLAPLGQPGSETITSHSGMKQDCGSYIPWGFYNFEIGRDGTYGHVRPDRTASAFYGYHLNAVKFLETDPCANCVGVDNIFLTPEGNVSVDVSITHPFTNPAYTGFDVMGIIMFPSSQILLDEDMRAEVGFEPWGGDIFYRIASSEKGDAELVNTEGWTLLWAPDAKNYTMWTETGFPIFEYYEGKFASGENLGTLNSFIRYHSNENRHMFEAGKTVTRTYIIKPPAVGPIEASYAVYAHWSEPDVMPVNDPATDFPLIANSSLPYELEIWQEGAIDPDAPSEVKGESIHIHMKHWGVIPLYKWDLTAKDYIGSQAEWAFEPYPDGDPDEYWPTGFGYGWYYLMPDPFPGTWPFVIRITQNDPDPFGPLPSATWWMMDVEFGELDGQW